MPLRFTIRDLLWLTLVVALIVGWWIDHPRTAKDRYRVSVSIDGKTITLLDSETGVMRQMPSESMAPFTNSCEPK